MAEQPSFDGQTIWQKVKALARPGVAFLRAKWAVFHSKYPRLSIATAIVGGLFGGGLIFLFGLFFLIWTGLLGPLPTYGELKDIQHNTASEVYAEDGVLLGKYYIENRVNAAFEEISPNVVNALVATEDARFFAHNGVDLRAWFRVFFKTVLLSNESSGGGSTLSQQLAKNLYKRKRYLVLSTLVNKIREILIARRLERIYSKEQLLALYLNTVPFSENAFGIKVAAQRFYNKSPQDLKIEEAALLVGMLKANTTYNPVRHPEKSLERRNTVLDRMEDQGHINAEQCESLKKLPLKLNYQSENSGDGLATYFREHLRVEVEKILEGFEKPNGEAYNLYTDGLKIYTTINAEFQSYAETAVREHLPKLQQSFDKEWKNAKPWGNDSTLEDLKKRSPRYQSMKELGFSEKEINEAFNTPVKMRVFNWAKEEDVREMTPMDSIKYYLTMINVGFLAIEPNTGLVRTWVGGIDYQYFQYDHVKARRQIGSTFKPVVFAQALRSGMRPCEYTSSALVMYDDVELEKGGTGTVVAAVNEAPAERTEGQWTPRNSDGKYSGMYSMEGALCNSVNTVAVKTIMRTGVKSVRQLAKEMGMEADLPNDASIALGTGQASLMEMLQVFGTFANRGQKPVLHYLDRIETADGKVLVTFDRPNPQEFQRVLTPLHADMMSQMLKSVIERGTGSRVRWENGLYNVDLAGKTGTTQNHSDGWFVGFTPNLIAGVWIGAALPTVHFRSMYTGQASVTAVPVWGRFMGQIYKNEQYKSKVFTRFTAPPDTTMALMRCPYTIADSMALEEMEEEIADSLKIEQTIDDRPRRENETEEEYAERMERLRRRLEKREENRDKLKDFWNNTLFGKDKEKKEEKKEGGGG